MAIYFARWKDGSFSIVDAADDDEAYELLDEFGDEPAELSLLECCLIDFDLTDRGSFRLSAFGEVMLEEILDRGYPLLKTALDTTVSHDYHPDRDDVPENVADVPVEVANAIDSERKRFAAFRPAPASTEWGKDIQKRTKRSGRYADAIVRRKAAERLARLPVDKKQKPN